MMKLTLVAARFADLEAEEIALWVERGWVRPVADQGEWSFEAIDLARLDLIYDLRRKLGVAEDTVPLILGLVDQLHDLRAAVDAMHRAIEGQPASVRDAMQQAIRRYVHGI